MERNLQDAMHVARNIYLEPRLVPGGGAVEMEVGCWLTIKARSLNGVIQGPYKALSSALEIIPRTIASNCGANTIRTLTALRAKHAEGENAAWGVDGITGKLENMMELGILEPLAVKLQTYKTAVETAILILRIDDIVSGSKKKDQSVQAAPE
jgi:T-complex protein 1 subunit gamma